MRVQLHKPAQKVEHLILGFISGTQGLHFGFELVLYWIHWFRSLVSLQVLDLVLPVIDIGGSAEVVNLVDQVPLVLLVVEERPSYQQFCHQAPERPDVNLGRIVSLPQ